MNSVGRILLLALALTAAATLACRDSDDAAPAPSPTTAVVDSTSPATDTPSPAAPAAQSAASPTGIWVAGEGTIDLEPDLALLNVGVEVQAKTVSEARGEAAAAMDAVIAAVKAPRPHRRRHPDLLVQHLAAVRLRRGRSDPGRLPRLQHGDDQDA